MKMAVEAIRLPAKNCSEIETEPVDTHVLRPLAQGIRYHLEDTGMGKIQRVAGARVVM
jgi:hypothetical protein